MSKFIVAIICVFFGFIGKSQDYYVEQYVDLSADYNKSLFVTGNEVSKVLIDGTRSELIKAYRVLALDSIAELSLPEFQKQLKLPGYDDWEDHFEEEYETYQYCCDSNNRAGSPGCEFECGHYYPFDDMDEYLYFPSDLYVLGISFSFDTTELSLSNHWISLYLPEQHPDNILGIRKHIASFRYQDALNLLSEKLPTWHHYRNPGDSMTIEEALKPGSRGILVHNIEVRDTAGRVVMNLDQGFRDDAFPVKWRDFLKDTLFTTYKPSRALVSKKPFYTEFELHEYINWPVVRDSMDLLSEVIMEGIESDQLQGYSFAGLNSDLDTIGKAAIFERMEWNGGQFDLSMSDGDWIFKKPGTDIIVENPDRYPYKDLLTSIQWRYEVTDTSKRGTPELIHLYIPHYDSTNLKGIDIYVGSIRYNDLKSYINNVDQDEAWVLDRIEKRDYYTESVWLKDYFDEELLAGAYASDTSIFSWTSYDDLGLKATFDGSEGVLYNKSLWDEPSGSYQFDQIGRMKEVIFRGYEVEFTLSKFKLGYLELYNSKSLSKALRKVLKTSTKYKSKPQFYPLSQLFVLEDYFPQEILRKRSTKRKSVLVIGEISHADEGSISMPLGLSNFDRKTKTWILTSLLFKHDDLIKTISSQPFKVENTVIIDNHLNKLTNNNRILIKRHPFQYKAKIILESLKEQNE